MQHLRPRARPRLPAPTRVAAALFCCLGLAVAPACGDLVAPAPPSPQPAPPGNDPSFPPGETPTPPRPGEPLALTSVEPATAPVEGGVDVMLRGTGFADGMEVLFDQSPALDVVVVTSQTAIATAPPHPAGLVDLLVSHPRVDGGEAQLLPGSFRYESPIVVDAIAPPAGRREGGEPVTVRGRGFTADSRLFIGGRPALGLAVVDGGTLTGLTPPGVPGLADVHVTGFNGVAALPDAFRYLTPPVVTAVSPPRGLPAGGERVRLSGEGLELAAAVHIGASAAAVIAADPGGAWLDVSAPPGPAGVVDVSVATSEGIALAERAYVYAEALADPRELACDTVFPAHGAEAGGTVVSIACAGLAHGAVARFGGALATPLTTDAGAGELRVEVPAGEGVVDVVVTSPYRAVTLRGAFRYDPPSALSLTAISPRTGPRSGGTRVTLTGRGFAPGATVLIGALPATSVRRVDANTLEATTPAGAPGAADVLVRSSGSEAKLPAGFDFAGALAIDLVAPTSAAQSGGTWLRVHGAGFGADAVVTIGGVPCALERRVGSAELDVRSPRLPVGVYDAVVTSGGASATLPRALSTFDPRAGNGGTWGPPIDDTVNVTVYGTGGYGPIADAFVILGDDPTTPLRATTDELGQVSISAPGLRGPVTVTASRAGFSSYSIVRFDAQNATVLLRQDPVSPTPNLGDGGTGGPPPFKNATLSGRVFGLDKYVVAPPGACEGVLIADTEHCAPCEPQPAGPGCDGASFACVEVGAQGPRCVAACEVDADCPAGYGCGATSAGARCLPSPGERAAYCNVASTSPFGYEYPVPATGWVGPGGTYLLDSQTLGDLAVYCFGGYRAADGTFTPTVLGVRRHVEATPGAILTGLDVELRYPLQRTFRLRLQDPPTWPTGLMPPSVVISLDLGADGVIPMSRALIPTGPDTYLAPRQLARLTGDLYDASYFFYTTLQAGGVPAYPRSYNLVQAVTRVVEDRLPVRDEAGAWRLEGTQIERDLHGLVAAAPGATYAVGEGGLVLLYDGSRWTEQTSRTVETLRAVAARAPQDLWAVGDEGTVRHFDGLAWQPVPGPPEDLRAVTTGPGLPVFAAGEIRVWRYDDGGSGWVVAGPPALQAIAGLAARADGTVAAVGSLGRVFVRSPEGVWARLPVAGTAPQATLRGVAFIGDAELVAVGDGGLLLAGTVEAGLAVVPTGTRADLTAVTGLPDGQVVAVGDFGAVLARDASGAWRSETIADYRSRASAVVALPGSGVVRVVGSAAFILGPFMHFPIITSPLSGGTDPRTILGWSWSGGPDAQYTRLRVTPYGANTLWELMVEGLVDAVILPDLLTAAGLDAIGHGRRRLEVTRVLNANFDIDAYSSRDLSIYLRQTWAINEAEFIVP